MNRGLAILILTLLAPMAWGGEVHVSAYYYPLYKGDLDKRFDRTLRSQLEPPQLPVLGRYDSNDASTLKQHREWSKDYGIDTWICSWNGTEYWSDYIIHEQIAVSDEDDPITFSILYESASRLEYRRGIVLDKDNAQTLREDMQYIAWNYFHRENYQRIDGRPVVYLKLSREYKGDVAGTLRRIRRDMLDIGKDIFIVGDEISLTTKPDIARLRMFDAITSYTMYDGKDYAGYPSETGYVEAVKKQFALYKKAAEEAGVLFIPNVMPGFNNKGVRPRGTIGAIPRKTAANAEEGSTLAALCDAVNEVMGDSDYYVTVTSWNNWGEDTQVEPVAHANPTSNDSSEKEPLTEGYLYTGYETTPLEILKDKFGK